MHPTKNHSDISDSSDASWVRLKNKNETSSQDFVDTPHRDVARTPTQRQNSTPLMASPSNNTLKRHHTHPATQSERGDTPFGSSDRLLAIQKALDGRDNKHSYPHATPSQKQGGNKYRVIVVSSDEEEEEDTTDVETPFPSSSQSSVNTVFSSTSASGSTSSIETPSKIKASKSDTERPAVVRDVFHPAPTTKRTPNFSRSQPPLPAAQSQDTNALPQTVLDFASSPFGTDLQEMIIAHSNDLQKLLDDNQIAWGVQYELARGLSAGLLELDQIKDLVHKLKGTNAEAAFKVERIMKSRETSGPSDVRLWRQLDLEQEAIMENKGRGLGLMGDFRGESDWYGGRIQQLGRVTKDGTSFAIKLERMESRRSNRFARHFGSRRFLQIRVPEDFLLAERDKVKRFFRRKFILFGRVFIPFHAKEKNVYLVETNENYGRHSQEWCGDQFRSTLNEFINWHNPLDVLKNTKQVISKYTARFALGLSNSKPAVEFDEQNIFFIDDITADDWPKDEKSAPADKLMTDGCGFLNHAALHRIVQNTGYDSIPAGVQGRIDGSKGFFILHPTDTSVVSKVWIRDSQNKIKNRSFDRAHRIFDLLSPSRPSPPVAITSQSIINMFANGIPEEMLVQLMEQSLDDEVSPLLEWDNPKATLFLYDAISKCGGVPGARAQRVSYALNRVLGFTGRDWHDNNGLVEENEEEEECTGRNKYSGVPLGLHEVAIELLQSGFHPRENKLLQEKIEYIIKGVIKSSTEKYRIPIAESVGAFIVPDPLGVLEEGEVCYRFSKPRKDLETEMLCYALEGEILLGRYPIRLPSDIQKVTAVHKRELDKWPDVLIVSTKGNRSIASLLADGDMDGDEIIAIYNQALVSLFRNQQFTRAPPEFIKQNFTRDVETVQQFCSRVSTLSSRQAHEAFQEVLVANLSESRVGLYSMMHEKACIKYGYGSDDAIRLAYVFATLLDSSKNGCRLKSGLFEKDRKKYGFFSNSQQSPVMDDILGKLLSAGKKKGDELLERYKALAPADWEADDETLRRPFELAGQTADKCHQRGFAEYRKELNAIVALVDEAYGLYSKAWRDYFDKKEQESQVKEKKSKVRKEKKEDVILESARKFAEPIHGLELIQNVEEIKASYAYVKKPKFAFQVAFRELCLLKAKSMPGGFVPSLLMFDEAKKINGSYMRASRWADKESVDAERRV